MRKDVVVTESWDDRDRQTAVCGIGEDVEEPLGHHAVGTEDLGRSSRYSFVIVVTRTVSGPNDKVDLVLEVLLYPGERRVDQGKGRIAVGGFASVGAGVALAVMADAFLVGGGMDFVELVGVEIWWSQHR